MGLFTSTPEEREEKHRRQEEARLENIRLEKEAWSEVLRRKETLR